MDEDYTVITTSSKLSEIMEIVSASTFEVIIRKLQEISTRYERMTYHEFKYNMEILDPGTEYDQDRFQSMRKFMMEHVAAIIEILRNMEEAIAHEGAAQALINLTKLERMEEDVKDEEVANAILYGKDTVKV
jgi:hypothetical protein